MQKTTLEKIKEAVEQAQKFPTAKIEYNLELPKEKGITADNFYGVRAVFNKNVAPEKGCNVIFSY